MSRHVADNNLVELQKYSRRAYWYWIRRHETRLN